MLEGIRAALLCLLQEPAFYKNQRVSHAAIAENKRLGAALADLKEGQEKTPPRKRRAGQ
ncbi:hypothetical protein JMJ94_02860 [Rhodovulum visakhapatnamense]|uniref:Uncharacterized protein n=1 Tax=Rhodovulum visakhapatnamense TaxID=364297 RepID=A0ABS1RKH0_9RHOB|nr:hypothetical protein [Rhodovulum visakhapatnamense]MBL3568439.1 hypothetical protein [Rhodovulum visakhapatnamense]MBL3579196.1 hypothetical protein [Rhodovulum visakhapatnamense]